MNTIITGHNRRVWINIIKVIYLIVCCDTRDNKIIKFENELDEIMRNIIKLKNSSLLGEVNKVKTELLLALQVYRLELCDQIKEIIYVLKERQWSNVVYNKYHSFLCANRYEYMSFTQIIDMFGSDETACEIADQILNDIQ